MSSEPIYIVVGTAVVVLSLCATWFLSDRLLESATSSLPIFATTNTSAPEKTPAAPAPGPPVTQVTRLEDLPKPAASAFAWAGTAGLNVQANDGTPLVSGQPILRLIAIPTEGPHTLAVRFTTLKNRMYRITAWVKPEAGGSFGIAASDVANTGANFGSGVFNLTGQRVHGSWTSGISVLSAGSWRAGIGEGPGDWLKVWIDLPTSTGQFVINSYLCLGRSETFKGDGRLGVILGGFALEPIISLTTDGIFFGILLAVILFWAMWFAVDQWLGRSTSSSTIT